MSDEEKLTEKQQEIVNEYHRYAESVIAWLNNLPELENISRAFIMSAVVGRTFEKNLAEEHRTVSEEEIDALIKWITKQYVEITLLHGILRGWTGVRFDTEKGEPVFWVTERGRAAQEELL